MLHKQTDEVSQIQAPTTQQSFSIVFYAFRFRKVLHFHCSILKCCCSHVGPLVGAKCRERRSVNINDGRTPTSTWTVITATAVKQSPGESGSREENVVVVVVCLCAEELFRLTIKGDLNQPRLYKTEDSESDFNSN